MTTRSRQKLSSILTVFSIVALLLLIVFVWTAVRNGVFSSANDTHGSYRLRPINPNESSASVTTTSTEHSSHHHTAGHHARHHQHHRHNESTTLPGKCQTHLLFARFHSTGILYCLHPKKTCLHLRKRIPLTCHTCALHVYAPTEQPNCSHCVNIVN